jgi:hypothetical protein
VALCWRAPTLSASHTLIDSGLVGCKIFFRMRSKDGSSRDRPRVVYHRVHLSIRRYHHQTLLKVGQLNKWLPQAIGELRVGERVGRWGGAGWDRLTGLYMYIYIHIYVYVYIYIYADMYIYICMFIYIYIHIIYKYM